MVQDKRRRGRVRAWTESPNRLPVHPLRPSAGPARSLSPREKAGGEPAEREGEHGDGGGEEHRGEDGGLAVVGEIVEAGEDGGEADGREDGRRGEIELRPAKKQERGEPAAARVEVPDDGARAGEAGEVQGG